MVNIAIAYNYHPNENVAAFMAQQTRDYLSLLGHDVTIFDLEELRLRAENRPWYNDMLETPSHRKQLVFEAVNMLSDGAHLFDFHDSNHLLMGRKPKILQNYWYYTVECPAVYGRSSIPNISSLLRGRELSHKEVEYFTTESDLEASIEEGLCAYEAVSELALSIVNSEWRT